MKQSSILTNNQKINQSKTQTIKDTTIKNQLIK